MVYIMLYVFIKKYKTVVLYRFVFLGVQNKQMSSSPDISKGMTWGLSCLLILSLAIDICAY